MQRLLIALIAASVGFSAVARAETVKLIVPFSAGGPTDMLARTVAEELGPRLGADIVVENRGGAGGTLGTELAARSPADGKTILFGTLGSHVISPTLRASQLSYDAVKAFDPIVLIGSVPSLLVVNPKLGVSSLKELIARVKGGQAMTYASAGPGSTMNIAGEMLNAAAGLKVTHVPYKGAAPAINDLLGGHVEMLNADFPVLLPLVNAKSVRALALYGTERSPLLPDVPTTAELGFPDMIMENWYGVFLPAGASPEIQARLEKAMLEVLQAPAVKERLASTGMRGTKDRAAFRKKLQEEFAYWKAAIKKLGITLG